VAVLRVPSRQIAPIRCCVGGAVGSGTPVGVFVGAESGALVGVFVGAGVATGGLTTMGR
jgi:hypothetical protein